MKRSLSKTEAKAILDLEWRGQKAVTLAELPYDAEAPSRYLRKTTSESTLEVWLSDHPADRKSPSLDYNH